MVVVVVVEAPDDDVPVLVLGAGPAPAALVSLLGAALEEGAAPLGELGVAAVSADVEGDAEGDAEGEVEGDAAWANAPPANSIAAKAVRTRLSWVDAAISW